MHIELDANSPVFERRLLRAILCACFGLGAGSLCVMLIELQLI